MLMRNLVFLKIVQIVKVFFNRANILCWWQPAVLIINRKQKFPWKILPYKVELRELWGITDSEHEIKMFPDN